MAFGLVVALWVAGARAGVTPGAPAPIEVPPELLRQNESIEPSGVVWAAPLDRYLIVSDDTGTKGRKHRPWVFAMSREGAFDGVPLVIRGIPEINDPEAICAGPDGTFFLTTSHSENRKGRTSEERRMLLHLRLEGRSLGVIGRLDLSTAHAARGGGLLEIAGLDPAGVLDIEALAFRQGALLIGLKGPLTPRGSAVILRFEGAVEALRAGRIEPGSVTRLQELALGATRREGGIGRGISDLTSLPDGSLVVLANSPKGVPGDGGGALFWVKPGQSTAVLLHEFSGLKPEGVTLADDGKGLVLVFDNDLRPPLWARWPLPH